MVLIIIINDAIKILHEICEKDSFIDCKLLANGLNNIVYSALQMANKYVKLKKNILKLFFSVFPSKLKKLCFFLFLLFSL